MRDVFQHQEPRLLTGNSFILWENNYYILQEVPNIDSFVWSGHLMHVSEDISASQTWINLSIAALEYNKPYI